MLICAALFQSYVGFVSQLVVLREMQAKVRSKQGQGFMDDLWGHGEFVCVEGL